MNSLTPCHTWNRGGCARRVAYHRHVLVRLVLLILLLAASAHAADPELFPIPQDGLWGFIDRSGRVVIEPRFEKTFTLDSNCRPFSDGLQPVRVGNAWGYVDARGTLAIPARFDSVSCFSEGLAAARPLSEPGKPVAVQFGYIDRRGTWVIRPAFDDAQPFSQGLAAVNVDHHYGYVDRRGRLAIPARYRTLAYECSKFSEGLACFEESDRWGFMDKRGKTIIPAQFESVGRFAEGLAVVRRPGSFQPSGYIDRSGAIVIAEKFFTAYNFAGGRARVQLENGRTAFIDRGGKPVFTLDGDYRADPFADGLARVKVTDAQRNETIGYVDAAGRFAIPPRFVDGTSFVNGLAFVNDCGPTGYIDTKGNPVWGLAKRQQSDVPPPPANLVTGEVIARASGYPGPLVVTAVPTAAVCTPFGKAAWDLSVSAADGSFSPAYVRLVERGTFLTREMRARFEKAVAASAGNPDAFVRPIANHPAGLTTVFGFGPGGAGIASVIPSPDDAYELLVQVFVASEGDGLTPNPAAQAYQERLGGDPLGVTEAIAVGAWDALYKPGTR